METFGYWKPIPLNELKGNDNIFARQDGAHYHLKKTCYMLQGGDFERLGYTRITINEITKRNLIPCKCAFRKEKQS